MLQSGVFAQSRGRDTDTGKPVGLRPARATHQRVRLWNINAGDGLGETER